MTSENAILTFEELDLSPQLLKALAQKGYKRPTSVQEQTIPYALDGRDFIRLCPYWNRKNRGIFTTGNSAFA